MPWKKGKKEARRGQDIPHPEGVWKALSRAERRERRAGPSKKGRLRRKRQIADPEKRDRL